MIIVERTYKTNIGEDLSGRYDYISDFLRDFVDESLVADWFNDCYGTVIVAGYTFNTGDVITKCLSEDDMSEVLEDFIRMEEDYLEGELEYYGKVDYYGYTLIDPKFDEDEEED